MRSYRSEPTLAEMLSDPLVRTLMAADRVAPEQLEQSLRKIAGTIEWQHLEPAGPASRGLPTNSLQASRAILPATNSCGRVATA